MKKTIQEIKEQVSDDIYEAFNQFCTNKVKLLKADMATAQERLEDARLRDEKLSKEFQALTTAELWKDFHKYDVCQQNSPYQRYLLGK